MHKYTVYVNNLNELIAHTTLGWSGPILLKTNKTCFKGNNWVKGVITTLENSIDFSRINVTAFETKKIY